MCRVCALVYVCVQNVHMCMQSVCAVCVLACVQSVNVCAECVYTCVCRMCRVCMYSVYMCLCECVLTYRGQFEGVGFLLHPWGSQELTWVPRLGSKHLYQLSHLSPPSQWLSLMNPVLLHLCFTFYILFYIINTLNTNDTLPINKSKEGYPYRAQQIPSFRKMLSSPWIPLCIPLSFHQPPTFALLEMTAVNYRLLAMASSPSTHLGHHPLSRAQGFRLRPSAESACPTATPTHTPPKNFSLPSILGESRRIQRINYFV